MVEVIHSELVDITDKGLIQDADTLYQAVSKLTS